MMSEREDRRLLKVTIAFIIGLFAIGIVVANIRYLDLGQGSPTSGPEIAQITLALIYALGAIGAGIVVLFLIRRKVGARSRRTNIQWTGNNLIALLVIVLLLVCLAAIQDRSLLMNQKQDPPIPGAGDQPNQPVNNPVANDATGGIGAIYLLITALIVALIIIAFRHNRTTPLRLAKAQIKLAQQDASEAVRQARMDLLSGEEPRAVIVRAYQQMSRLLEKGRSLSSLTPREVAELAKLNFGWPEGPLIELTSLFEEAWYSDHAMGENERDRALRAFESIASKEKERRTALGQPAS
jgi:hypothetical protein